MENETDPRTGQPFFPAAICSRMAAGCPLLFNHLGVNELERVVRTELDRVAGLLQLQYYKRVSFDDLVPMCLVLKEGARADARTLCAQAGTFLKNELFKFCQLFKTERLEEAFDQIDSIHLGLDGRPSDFEPDVSDLFEQQARPRALLIADADLTALYRENIAAVDWHFTSTADEHRQLGVDHRNGCASGG